MKCIVPVKRVIDPNVKVRIKSDGTAIETEHVKMSMNPFDEIALEEAVRQKESGKISEILAISIGNLECQETLREALARGADSAFLVETSLELESIYIAKILKILIEREKGELVFMGKQAIDDDGNQTGQMLAGLLQWGQGTNASKVEIDPSQKKVKVIREIDSGLETLELRLPAVITADLRLNEPRYISLPNLMKAKAKKLTVISLKNDLSFEPTIKTKVTHLEAPIMKRKAAFLNNAKELVEKLKNEAKVIS
jgi:electron transfer flavoprotein beta subunit